MHLCITQTNGNHSHYGFVRPGTSTGMGTGGAVGGKTSLPWCGRTVQIEKGTDLCAPGKAWSPGINGASRHEMA